MSTLHLPCDTCGQRMSYITDHFGEPDKSGDRSTAPRYKVLRCGRCRTAEDNREFDRRAKAQGLTRSQYLMKQAVLWQVGSALAEPLPEQPKDPTKTKEAGTE